MKTKTVFRVALIDNNDHHTTIRVWKNSDPRYVDFRGDAMSRWIDPDQWGNLTPTRAQLVHDGCLDGWHVSPLHAGDSVFICPHHSDFVDLQRLFDLN